MGIKIRRYRPNPLVYHLVNLVSLVCTIGLILSVLSDERLAIILSAIAVLVISIAQRSMD
jgi:hypothetical protein